jgi:hypothetical protein
LVFASRRPGVPCDWCKTASLLDPAFDRIVDFCAETRLVAILHSDVDMPFPKPGQDRRRVRAWAKAHVKQ